MSYIWFNYPFDLYSQLSDCYQGVVFDGLETLFTRSMSSALLCLLKAINNRRYIFFVNLFQDYVAMKAREKAKLEQEGKKDVLSHTHPCVNFGISSRSGHNTFYFPLSGKILLRIDTKMF